MYTGELKQDDHLEGVLALADRYQIDELKHMCERKLCTKIDKNNLLEMLCFADLHNCRILRSGVIDTVSLWVFWNQITEDKAEELFMHIQKTSGDTPSRPEEFIYC